MAKKADFSAQEWAALCEAPQLVVLSVATAGASGLFGSLKEALAPVSAIVQAAKGNNELLRGICDREELKMAQTSIKSSIKLGGDPNALRDELQMRAADRAREAAEILQKKGSPGDLDAYRSFLVDIADRTANAAKEGGFMGFGGERVSEGERAAINRISQALKV